VATHDESQQETKNELWFRKRRLGWGFSPSNAKGWAVIVVWGVTVMLFASAFSKNAANAAIGIVIATVAMVAVSLIKGERPGHRSR
jgi:hypothetical protein